METVTEDISETRLDRPFAILAFFFCCWGLAEYFFPPTGDSFDRTVPKLTHAAIMATCLVCTIVDFRSSFHRIRFRGTMIAGAILSAILMLFPVFSFNRMTDQLGPFLLTKFYSGCYTIEWYAVFLFCSVHIQARPESYRTFLKFVPAMLVFFFLAGHKLTSLNVSSVSSEELQSGIYAGYYIVCLFPFVWDLKYRLLKFVLFLLIIYGVKNSMKRGAMLCLASSLLLSFLTYYIFFAEGVKRIPYFYAIGIILAVLVGASAYSVSMKQETFNRRIENIESGSGRIDLYKRAWNTFKSLPPDEKITGTRTQSKQIRAHNDFLFTMLSYGIVGLVFYVLFDLGLLLLFIQSSARYFSLLPGLVVTLGNIAVIEMISYGIEGHAFVICCAYAGIVQGFILSETEIDESYDDFKDDETVYYDDEFSDTDSFDSDENDDDIEYDSDSHPYFPQRKTVIPFPMTNRYH